MPLPPRRAPPGFTMIELMIVVAIIGILAAVAVPKFADLVRKSHEGATKGNLGAIRSALSIYYSDNEGRYPSGAAGSNTTFLQQSLTLNSKYLANWPSVHAAPYHNAAATVDSLNDSDAQGADATDDGEWVYVGNSSDSDWGKLMVECYHTDSKGEVWTTY